jgi:hypothetical protein
MVKERMRVVRSRRSVVQRKGRGTRGRRSTLMH